ncbi:Mitochondrial distribution and morphology protein [Senna tora]|uniref:Mitochondrial distribution and morphology protein n=1 Tax=Senna tora TaxID=362788 RepID=A0A834SY52_9FABA|nr:Mitochondrial distribution and morphology protein [Senna tora]
MASSSTTKLSLKLLIDTNAEKVLFAEASKDFIDFLFNLLRLPIGTVIRLLTKNGMVGCLGKLYESIENLNDTYLLNPTQHKEALLKPTAPMNSMSYAVTYVGEKAEEEVKKCSGEGGFVKEVVTYMVMDDLVVQPMSTISSITLLNKFHVKEVGSLQEKVVEVGMEEGIKLLKASLLYKNVLTTVFLKNV